VTSITLYNELNSSDTLNFTEIDFKIAFGIEGYFDKLSKDDPDYVEWVVSMEQKIGTN